MIKFVNAKGKVVMTESDTGQLHIVDEKLKADMKAEHTAIESDESEELTDDTPTEV